MGFMDLLKNAGSYMMEDMHEHANERMEWYERYSSFSASQLEDEYNRYRRGDIHKQMQIAAFRQVCRERGFLEDNQWMF